MRPHAFYPTLYPTVRARRSARLLRWLVGIVLLTFLIFGTAALIAILNGREAQLDSAFMQGMVAGAQMCKGGT